MKILNYTTSVSAERSYSQIQQQLIKIKALQIMSDFDEDGNIKSIAFAVDRNGHSMTFKLEANIEGVYRAMCRGKGSRTNFDKLKKQSVNVAWRILKDWVEAQVAMIEAEQKEVADAFLSHWIINGQNTLYHNLKEREFSFKALGPGGKNG